MELTVLGCSGSYGAPAGGACSGYLVRAGDDGALDGLRQRLVHEPAAARRSRRAHAVVITHGHPDHCVDLYGLHVMNKYGLERECLPVYAPEGVEKQLEGLVGRVDEHVRLAPGRRRRPPRPRRCRAALLAHRSPAADGRGRDRARRQAARVHLRHRPGVELRGVRYRCRPRALGGDVPARRHPCADPPLGPPGRRSGARRGRAALMLTHLWPAIDPIASVEEGSEAIRQGRRARRAAPRDPHLIRPTVRSSHGTR